MPALTEWIGGHPLVVHFPIALLAVAPLTLAIGLLGKGQRPLLGGALLIMALGTIGVWVAAASGGVTAPEGAGSREVAELIERHRELGETTRTIFTVLTLVFAALLAIPIAVRRELGRTAHLAVHGFFLVGYAAALVVLASTVQYGERLGHGARAPAGHAAVVPPTAPLLSSEGGRP